MNFWRRTLVFAVVIFAFSVRADEAAWKVGAICILRDERINESSGLAASRKYPERALLVTHNDSGGGSKLFYINLEGFTVAEVSLNHAANVDWEDIAIAGDFIYVGDIGDNLRRRESITIYRLREPEIAADKIGQKLEADWEKMTLKYPDGACDAETLMATAKGEIILVSKNGGKSRFYKTPRAFEKDTTQTLELIGEYAFKGETARSQLTTGGDLTDGETSFVIRTYSHAYVWNLREENWRQAIASTPFSWELPASRQGEAICYSFDGSEYFLSSEGVPTPIWAEPFMGEYPL